MTHVRKFLKTFFVALLLILAGTFIAHAATPPQPTYGSAIVDGDPGEWDLAEDGTGDFFANMYEAGKLDKTLLSKAYLRYSCRAQVLYVLVLVEDDVTADMSADDAWVKIYDLGNSTQVDGDSASFEWIYDNTTRIGYEASFALAPGSYDETEIHVSVTYDGESGRTSSTGKGGKNSGPLLPLTLNCPVQPQTGDLTVSKTVDSNGALFEYDPFEICIFEAGYQQGDDPVACHDFSDGDSFQWELPEGDYVVVETAPSFHWTVTGSGQTVTVSAEEPTAHEVVNSFNVENLTLTSICSDDPSVTRRWRVHNDNSFDVEFTYEVIGTAQTGDYIAPANSNFFFETATVGGANTTRIIVDGVENDVKASAGEPCTYGVEVTKVVDTGNFNLADQTFEICLTNNNANECVQFNLDGGSTTIDLPIGVYTVSENPLGDGWTADYPETITVTPNGGSVTVTNTYSESFNPAIMIEKTPDEQMIMQGETAHFTITVTNIGDVALQNVAVSDALAPDCDNTFGDLAVNGQVSYDCKLVNVTHSFTNVAIVTGDDPHGDPVTPDDDDAHVTVKIPEPEICQPGHANYKPIQDLKHNGSFIIRPGAMHGQVENRGRYCSYDIGLVSYIKFDDIIDHQLIFSSDLGVVKPGEIKELWIDLPQCATQVDLFFGPLLDNLNGQRYGARLLDAEHLFNNGYCNPNDYQLPDYQCPAFNMVVNGYQANGLTFVEASFSGIQPTRVDFDLDGWYHTEYTAPYVFLGDGGWDTTGYNGGTNMIVTPRYGYLACASQQYDFSQFIPQPVASLVVVVGPDQTIEAGSPLAPITVTVSNTGEVDIYSIRVSNDGPLDCSREPLDLMAGESYSFECGVYNDITETFTTTVWLPTAYPNGDIGYPLTIDESGAIVIVTVIQPQPITQLVEPTLADADEDGYTEDVDCNDADSTIHPDAEEIANDDIDQNCDGVDLIIVDEPVVEEPQPIDADGDSFADDVDCNDADSTIYPGAQEIANDGVDQDCDGGDLIIEVVPDSNEAGDNSEETVETPPVEEETETTETAE